MKRLTPKQKHSYEEDGYLLLESAVSPDIVRRLADVTQEFVARSRGLSESTPDILLGPGHCLERPNLRRIPQTVAFHPAFEEFGLRGPLLDLVEDLIGPDLRFHHSKLNFKSAEGGEEVKWHQDIQFWPHTNYSPLTIGVYLTDVDDGMAPMGVFAGSHRGPLFTLRDERGEWTGALSHQEVRELDFGKLRWLTGPAGSVTIHNCRMVHGSNVNRSPRMRPLLLHTYAPADAIPLTRLMDPVKFGNMMVRGSVARSARFDADPCPMPPDWGAGEYKSIFSVQEEKTG
jgi:ectoine hydroxylase-related dioxygenase (phytanoyl-CoA dioxygenase family)